MPKRFFKCDPDFFHCHALCCQSIDTYPGLSLGDYVRLSEETNEPISELWRSKGNIYMLSDKELRNGEFLLGLSLLHHPCPFLSLDNKCSIHDNLPIACASFPLFLYKYHSDELNDRYKDFECLRGAQLKPSQIKLVKELDQLIIEEASLEVALLWDGKPKYLYMPRISDFYKLADKAATLQARRYPHSSRYRSSMMSISIDEMRTIAKRRYIDANLFRRHATPFVFSLLEDEIAEKLGKLEDKAKDAFRETSRKWRKLRKKIE